jgi:hypothetical protein
MLNWLQNLDIDEQTTEMCHLDPNPRPTDGWLAAPLDFKLIRIDRTGSTTNRACGIR